MLRILLAAVIGLTGLVGTACEGTTSQNRPLTGGQRDRLTVLTYNVWHGLNPTGILRFAEQENPTQREFRLQCFYRHFRQLDPDIAFLQEVNPAPDRAARMARDLGRDYCFALDNAGVKIGGVGVPTNLRSGMAILAKKDLGLRALGSRKLSGPAGFANRWLSLQTKEFRYALAADVGVNGRRVLLTTVHLHHGPEADAEIRAAIDRMAAAGQITTARAAEIVAQFNQASARRRGELERAMAFARELGMDGGPMLLAGDFNASADSPELLWLKRDVGFRSATADDDPAKLLMTWDYQRNPNTHAFEDFVPVNEFEPSVMQTLNPIIVRQTKRLDYVFFRGFDGWFAPAAAGLFADQPYEGVMCSDHFGIEATFSQVP